MFVALPADVRGRRVAAVERNELNYEDPQAFGSPHCGVGYRAFADVILAPPRRRRAGGALAAATRSLKATFVDDDNWGTGYVGEYQITNLGPEEVPGWQLSFSLPADSGLVNSWNRVASVSGDEVSVTNASRVATLSPGGFADFEFQVDHSKGSGQPLQCSVDNGPCAGPGTASNKAAPASVPTTAHVKPPTKTTVPPARQGSAGFGPYLDMTLQPEDLAAISSTSGIRAFTLGFVVSRGHCAPAWGGVTPISSHYAKNAIPAFVKAGGAVIISFGGEAGTELAEACSSVRSLEKAYQEVVDTYRVYDLDFDIEGAAVSDAVPIAMRSGALALLQQDEASLGRRVEVSFTLPVLSEGFPGAEMGVLRSALVAGVHVSIVNPMTMDFGGAGTGPAPMGTYAIDAARAVHRQLVSIFPSYSAAQLWATMGITPMIGQNDVTDDVFTLSDASQVARFAVQRGIGRLSMWSVTRDKQCVQGVIVYDSSTCSGVLQSRWAFSHVLQAG